MLPTVAIVKKGREKIRRNAACLGRQRAANGRRSHVPVSTQFGERRAGINAAGQTPIEKLRDVHATLADFGLVNPDVRCLKFGGQIALGHPRLLPQPAQHPRQISIARRVLRLGHGANVARINVATRSLTQ